MVCGSGRSSSFYSLPTHSLCIINHLVERKHLPEAQDASRRISSLHLSWSWWWYVVVAAQHHGSHSLHIEKEKETYSACLKLWLEPLLILVLMVCGSGRSSSTGSLSVINHLLERKHSLEAWDASRRISSLRLSLSCQWCVVVAIRHRWSRTLHVEKGKKNSLQVELSREKKTYSKFNNIHRLRLFLSSPPTKP